MHYADGLTYQETADRLGLAYHTVKRHHEETRKVLGVSTLLQAYQRVRRMQRDANHRT